VGKTIPPVGVCLPSGGGPPLGVAHRPGNQRVTHFPAFPVWVGTSDIGIVVDSLESAIELGVGFGDELGEVGSELDFGPIGVSGAFIFPVDEDLGEEVGHLAGTWGDIGQVGLDHGGEGSADFAWFLAELFEGSQSHGHRIQCVTGLA